jgi:hypothetical protein
MRAACVFLVAFGLMATAGPATAGKLRFSPETFEIYGGLSNSPTKSTKQKFSYSGKKTIDFASDLAPGSILIRTYERKLYYILP